MICNELPILYSDSDGVITDFHAAAEQVLGHPWRHDGGKQSEAEQGAKLEKQEQFWENIPFMPDWEIYWNHIKKYNPHILTAVPGWDHSFKGVEDGKREWYRRNLPEIPQSQIHVVYRKDKALYATRFTDRGVIRNILIDDHPNNIKEFEAAGGIGIRHINAKITILKLKGLGYV